MCGKFKGSFIIKLINGNKGGAVVRALAFHQCGPGSNPGVDATCGLKLLLHRPPKLTLQGCYVNKLSYKRVAVALQGTVETLYEK